MSKKRISGNKIDYDEKFYTVLSRHRWCGYYGELANVQSFTYIFTCDFARKSNEVDIYGTGGTILAEMKGLLLNLTGLKRLELIDLELEELDGIGFCHSCSTELLSCSMEVISWS